MTACGLPYSDFVNATMTTIAIITLAGSFGIWLGCMVGYCRSCFWMSRSELRLPANTKSLIECAQLANALSFPDRPLMDHKVRVFDHGILARAVKEARGGEPPTPKRGFA